MSNISLTIQGRQFTVACAEGEEQHLLRLARTINQKLESMGDIAGQNETRMLLFASLILADEVHELKTRVSANAETVPVAELEALADKLEKVASQLEGNANNA